MEIDALSNPFAGTGQTLGTSDLAIANLPDVTGQNTDDSLQAVFPSQPLPPGLSTSPNMDAIGDALKATGNFVLNMLEGAEDFFGLADGGGGLVLASRGGFNLPDEILNRLPPQERRLFSAEAGAAGAIILPPNAIERLRDDPASIGDVILDSTLWMATVPTGASSGINRAVGGTGGTATVLTVKLGANLEPDISVRRGAAFNFNAGLSGPPGPAASSDSDIWTFINVGASTGRFGNAVNDLLDSLQPDPNTGAIDFRAIDYLEPLDASIVTGGALVRIPGSETFVRRVADKLLIAGGVGVGVPEPTSSGLGFMSVLAGAFLKGSNGFYVGWGGALSELSINPISGETSIGIANNTAGFNLYDAPAIAANILSRDPNILPDGDASALDQRFNPDRNTIADILQTPTLTRGGEQVANRSRLNLYLDEYLENGGLSRGQDIISIAALVGEAAGLTITRSGSDDITAVNARGFTQLDAMRPFYDTIITLFSHTNATTGRVTIDSDIVDVLQQQGVDGLGTAAEMMQQRTSNAEMTRRYFSLAETLIANGTPFNAGLPQLDKAIKEIAEDRGINFTGPNQNYEFSDDFRIILDLLSNRPDPSFQIAGDPTDLRGLFPESLIPQRAEGQTTVSFSALPEDNGPKSLDELINTIPSENRLDSRGTLPLEDLLARLPEGNSLAERGTDLDALNARLGLSLSAANSETTWKDRVLPLEGNVENPQQVARQIAAAGIEPGQVLGILDNGSDAAGVTVVAQENGEPVRITPGGVRVYSEDDGRAAFAIGFSSNGERSFLSVYDDTGRIAETFDGDDIPEEMLKELNVTLPDGRGVQATDPGSYTPPVTGDPNIPDLLTPQLPGGDIPDLLTPKSPGGDIPALPNTRNGPDLLTGLLNGIDTAPTTPSVPDPTNVPDIMPVVPPEVPNDLPVTPTGRTLDTLLSGLGNNALRPTLTLNDLR